MRGFGRHAGEWIGRGRDGGGAAELRRKGKGGAGEVGREVHRRREGRGHGGKAGFGGGPWAGCWAQRALWVEAVSKEAGGRQGPRVSHAGCVVELQVDGWSKA